MSAARPIRHFRRCAPSPLRTGRWALLASSLLVADAGAQERSQAQIEADIEFARGLAAEWSFVDLAQSVLDRTEKLGVTGKMREELGLVTCEVFAVGARSERDDTRRNQLFLDAISAYERFLAENPFSEYKGEAEASLVTTASQYGQSVDIALESVVGEEAEALTKSKLEVLERTVKLTQDMLDSLLQVPADERSEKQNRQLESLMLNRGAMLGEMGRSSGTGSFYFARAIDALENMVFTVNEGTPGALKAYKVMGDVYTWAGDITSAGYMYMGVVDQALPLDPERMAVLVENNGGPFTAEQIAVRYLFLEIAMEGLLNVLQAQGEVEQACAYALHYFDLRQRHGLNWTVPAGYQSLLACARTLLEAGGYVGGDQQAGNALWYPTEEAMKAAVSSRREHDDAVNFALTLANLVNRDNKGNVLQVRAQKLLSEISNRPGVRVSPAVLVEAAEGEFYAGNYDQAIEGLHRVLLRLDALDPSDRLQYGARIMRFLGDAHRLSGRDLEAAMAYREGVVSWRGDAEYDAINAQRYLGMMRNIAAKAQGDQVVKALLTEAEDLSIQVGKNSGGAIPFSRGIKAYDNKAWSEAIASFKEVPADDDLYEKALVKIAVCKFRDGKVDEAVAGLNEYLETYIGAYKVESEVRKAKRVEAMAEAEFFRGLAASIAARQSQTEEAPGGDAALQQRVIELLAGYAGRYPIQDTLAPWTLEMLVDAHIALEQLPEARATVDEMVGNWKDNKRTAGAIKAYYNALLAVRDKATEPRKTELLREMAGFLKVANQVGSPDFQSYRNEMRHWYDLGEFEESLRITEKLMGVFESDANREQDMVRYVLPDYGHILLELGRVADAKGRLEPLVLAEGARPSKETVLDWTRSVAGWLVGGAPGDPVREVAGAGGTPEEWQQVIDKLDVITKVGDERWTSCEWYEQKLMIVYAYYAWSHSDQRKLDSAKNQIGLIDSTIQDPTYASVEKFCTPGESDDSPETIQRLGAGVLQARYTYMSNKLR